MVGVVGAGSFGSAVSNLLAENRKVLLYARRQEVADEIRSSGMNHGRKMHPGIIPTTDLKELADTCRLIYPIVPSSAFRAMARALAPHLTPEHILIHGTKGVDVQLPEGDELSAEYKLNPKWVNTMSEVILQETVVRRVGCLAGPNLAAEILEGQPAATVLASHFDEVIK